MAIKMSEVLAYNELIDAFRYCAGYGSYKKGCSKCPINANGMVCGTHEDAIAKAADAIDELKRNWEFTSDLLNLAIRTGARSMSELIALYEIEQKEGDE